MHEASSGTGKAPKLDRDSAAEEGVFVTPEQRLFFGLCTSYKDTFFPLRPYPTRCLADLPFHHRAFRIPAPEAVFSV